VLHEQAAGFALDALDPSEASEFERHLRSCRDCEEAIEPLRATAAALAFAGELSSPPAGLRLRVLDVGDAAVIPLRRRWVRPLFAAAAVAAACATIVVAVPGGSGESSVAGMKAYGVSGADGTLLVSAGGEGVLVVQDLPAPAAGTVYELWVVRGGSALPAGFLRGSLGLLTRPVRSGSGVAVSVEPAGGSRRPTGPLLLRAETA
jgi:anti-sigma-K factor RskA